MFYLIFAILMGLACPSGTNTNNGNDTVYTNNGGDDGGEEGTGGDTGQVPPKP